ncbi:hypothetical protein Desaf_2624 [Desulfocurvibacter africanus subsp. africanus str. Walvis Bay]|uniref:Uncharacterized protein n=1 Tax=Desulfocurvibacter africanus subsp. africanus str. Walvis Bay TaxID=690850 RepID=F3Z0D2_DESAF|nr:hypothetical protein Desaf_2624 [Desulfocurvibacter africanus subsp. africanus str. Walvis Bay]
MVNVFFAFLIKHMRKFLIWQEQFEACPEAGKGHPCLPQKGN